MSKRTAKFVSAVFASILAGAPLATISCGAARAADECLSGPKEQMPAGGHWYYRIDHATKRHCWYLGEERDKLSQTAPSNSTQSEQPLSPKPATAMQPSVADAHAELPAQTRSEQPSPDLAPALSADAAIREDSRDTRAAETQRSVVASRWPDQAAGYPAANPPPKKPNTMAEASSTAPAQPPVLGAGPFAAADPRSETPAHSMPMQLAALMGALALAGIAGSLVFRFGGARPAARGKTPKHRGMIWDPTDDDRILLSAHPEADVLPRPTAFARELERAGRNDRIEKFFSQLSKRTPA